MSENQQPEEKVRLRDNLYSHIKIPVKTMDVIIVVLVCALVVFIAAGIFFAA